MTGTTSYTADYTDGSGNPVSTTWEGGNWYMVGQRQTPDGLTVFSGKNRYYISSRILPDHGFQGPEREGIYLCCLKSAKPSGTV